MKEKNKEEKIEVLDEGIDTDDSFGPRGYCCRANVFAFR